MKKELCALALSLAMLGQLVTPVFAYGNSSLGEDYSIDTEFENIKMNEDGEYALEIVPQTRSTGTTYLPVGRLDIDPFDSGDVNKVLQTDLEEETKGEILTRVEDAKKNGNFDLQIAVFSPELLSNETVRYYSYQGHEMKTEIIANIGESTGPQTIASGPNTQEITADVFNVIISAVGLKNIPVAILGTGLSVLSLFSDFSTKLVSGSASDYFVMRLAYDSQTQFTYAAVGTDWYLGLVSSAVTLNSIATEQYYKNYTGTETNPLLEERFVSISAKSENFDSPWAKAYQYYLLPEEELLRWTVGNVTFIF